MQTFYIAGSSKNREEIAERGRELEGYGLRWFAGWDWPRLDAKNMENELMWAGVVCGDLNACVGCDVFVLYMKPGDPRSMSWAEFGARIAHCKEAHVIHEGHRDVFWGHPCVIEHKTWGDFVLWLQQDLYNK